jgi:hypothetical protein
MLHCNINCCIAHKWTTTKMWSCGRYATERRGSPPKNVPKCKIGCPRQLSAGGAFIYLTSSAMSSLSRERLCLKPFGLYSSGHAPTQSCEQQREQGRLGTVARGCNPYVTNPYCVHRIAVHPQRPARGLRLPKPFELIFLYCSSNALPR